MFAQKMSRSGQHAAGTPSTTGAFSHEVILRWQVCVPMGFVVARCVPCHRPRRRTQRNLRPRSHEPAVGGSRLRRCRRCFTTVHLEVRQPTLLLWLPHLRHYYGWRWPRGCRGYRCVQQQQPPAAALGCLQCGSAQAQVDCKGRQEIPFKGSAPAAQHRLRAAAVPRPPQL